MIQLVGILMFHDWWTWPFNTIDSLLSRQWKSIYDNREWQQVTSGSRWREPRHANERR